MPFLHGNVGYVSNTFEIYRRLLHTQEIAVRCILHNLLESLIIVEAVKEFVYIRMLKCVLKPTYQLLPAHLLHVIHSWPPFYIFCKWLLNCIWTFLCCSLHKVSLYLEREILFSLTLLLLVRYQRSFLASSISRFKSSAQP